MNKPDIEFEPWPKIPRLCRDIVITEKIDGTNAGILVDLDGIAYSVHASSRKRWITPEDDNYGFAAWVEENKETLAQDLGSGMHFGEWWGAGIQRRYGLDHKRFSLFNTRKWPVLHNDLVVPFTTPNLHVVPVLYQGPFSERAIRVTADRLAREGSIAAIGFDKPEGIVVYFPQAQQPFKYTFGGDGAKGDNR